MGGKCQICGYNRSFQALDLHHLNPSEKEFSISNALKNCTKMGTNRNRNKKMCFIMWKLSQRSSRWFNKYRK